MNPPVEPALRQGLRELADVPGPPDLAGDALRGARSIRRRRRIALSGAAAVAVAVAVAVPLLPRPDTPDAPAGRVEAAPPAGCRAASVQWSAFVAAATARLVAGGGSVTRFGYGFCAQTGPAPNAYAVVDVGAGRGRLTLSLYRHVEPAGAYVACDSFGPARERPQSTESPALCEDGADVAPEPVYVDCGALGPVGGPPPPPTGKLLFCQPGSAGAPAAFGLDRAGFVTVTAVYPDGRAVSLRSSAPGVGAAALRAVVNDRATVELLPAG